MAWSLSNTTSADSGFTAAALSGAVANLFEKTPATAAAFSSPGIATSGTYTFFFVAPAGEPGAAGITGDYKINLNLSATSLTAGSLALTLYRYNSAGVLQTTGSTQSTTSVTAGGIKSFTWTAQSLGTWAAGDRLVIKGVVTNTGTASRTVTITPGGPNNGVVRPWDPNLVTLPEAINLWSTLNQATVTADAVTSPDGATTADKLVEATSTGGTHYVTTDIAGAVPIITLVSGTTYTWSCYFKPGERDGFLLEMGNAGGSSNVDILFYPAGGTTSVFGRTGSYASTTFTNSVVDVGGGWYRLISTFICAVTSNHYTLACTAKSPATGLGDFVFDGVAGNGIYVWGTVIEAGSTATDYPSIGVGGPPDFLPRRIRRVIWN